MQKYGELLRMLLEKRGILKEEQADIFLNPDYKRDLHDPFLMRDMERACVRLFEAIENKEKVVIYADYDCDGIPGAVILRDLLRALKYENYEVSIPKRNSEGYGLSLEAIERFATEGVKLIITIDLGITSVSEVAQAEVEGIDTIITDHHIPPAVLPRAYAILNPKTDNYPEKMLCGAGIVFKLVQGFIKKYGEYFEIKNGAEKWMLDMAGLATLADMVPLTGENRAITYFGMKVLRKSPRPGLQKLFAQMNIDQKYLSEDDVTFMIIPKINAASRMDDPMRAFELLATADESRAGVLAHHLGKINDERKTMVISIMREVNKKLDAKGEEKDVLVIGNPNWRVGVLGLVAGKICDQRKKPIFVWGRDENDCIRGSCRSDGSVSVVELMTATRESFIDFGGHELAGGFAVHNDKIHCLEEALSANFHKVKRDKKESSSAYDVKSNLDIVNIKNWREIEKLAPFGFENPKPVFLFESTRIENIRKFGKNGSEEHLEIVFSRTADVKSKKAKAISFFSTNESFKTLISEGKNVNLLATFDLSRWKGKEELRLRVVDIT